MKIEGSYRQMSAATIFLWTCILLVLSCGVLCNKEGPMGFEKRQTEIHPFFRNEIDAAHAINIIRKILGRRQLQEQSALSQMINNGDGLSDITQQYQKNALPYILMALLSGMNEESFEEMKRSNNIPLCHFKICNMGRR